MDKQAVIVVRSSGERTLDACVSLLKSQSKEYEIHVIKEHPFDAALLSCYKIGRDSGLKWLVTVDADMLLCDGAVDTLIDHANQMPQHYFQLQGRIFDKVTGTIRLAGPRIYRTSMLQEAIAYLEKSTLRIRPEYSVIQEMVQKGHPSRSISKVTCLHDFEQYYGDLYRKAFVHAIKHEEMLQDLIKRCGELMETDDDFKVILKGLWDGTLFKSAVSIDSREFVSKAEAALKELGLDEKPSEVGPVSAIMGLDVEAMADADPMPPFQDHTMVNNDRVSRLNYTKNQIHQKGFIKGIRSLMGGLLAKLGNRMQSD